MNAVVVLNQIASAGLPAVRGAGTVDQWTNGPFTPIGHNRAESRSMRHTGSHMALACGTWLMT